MRKSSNTTPWRDFCIGSKTRYADKFILKGGLLFYVWNLPLRRPTRDIDFRGYVSGNRSTLLKIINEVIEVSALEDGIVFDAQSVSVEEKQIDIGFSDELVSKTEAIEYPNILPDLKTVRMKGYPKTAVVAEKFHAMVRHAELNSRMKDYYDLWLISETFEFDGRALQTEIESTFRKRDTEIPSEQPLSLSAEFVLASQTRWVNFLNKMELENPQVENFQDIVEKIWTFIEHPLQASISQTKSTRKWIPQKGWR